MDDWLDEDLREALRELDQEEDAEVTSWEAGFIESVAYKYKGPLSPAQRQAAIDLLEGHGYG